MNTEERIKGLENALANLETKCIRSELLILELDRRSRESERRSLESDRGIIRGIIEVLSNIAEYDFSDMKDKLSEILKQVNQQIDIISGEIDDSLNPEIERLGDLLKKAHDKSGEL